MTRVTFGRRKLMASLAVTVAGLGAASLLAPGRPTSAGSSRITPAVDTPEGRRGLYDAAVAAVLPGEGFRSRVALQDSVPSLVRHGVIAPEKLGALYQRRDEAPSGEGYEPLWGDLFAKFAADGRGPPVIPTTMRYTLEWPSLLPMLLTRESANEYVNLLWPLGLANRMTSNERSPVNGDRLFGFASTGGWTLGREANGGAYFNRFPIVPLTPAQEALATRVAETTYRPCCNNSTFFQDCNHGSALLGVLELGAAQGLGEDQLYREALGFNSFWFPDTYVKTALYFRIFEDLDWQDVEPKLVMGYDYSAAGPWRQTVLPKIMSIPDLLPSDGSGARCGV